MIGRAGEREQHVTKVTSEIQFKNCQPILQVHKEVRVKHNCIRQESGMEPMKLHYIR